MKIHGASALNSAAAVGLLWASLPSPVAGLTVDWDANSVPEKVEIEQCDDLVFNVQGTHNIVEFGKRNRFKSCIFDNTAKLMHDVVSDTEVTISNSGERHLKRKKFYYGSSHNDDCNANNMKTLVEVVPKFDMNENQACAAGGSEILSFGAQSIEQCQNACISKNECVGFEFMPGGGSTCTLFDKAPSAGAAMDGAACYAGQTSCPAATYPACTMDMVMECTVNDGTGRDCSEVDFIVPEETDPGTIQIGNPCEVQLRYDYKVEIKTTEAITVTSMMRTRKGAEVATFARPREYDWLNDGTFPKTVIGGVTMSADSSEEVFVDFCEPATYKTLIEGSALSDKGATVCTGRDQYKLVVKPK